MKPVNLGQEQARLRQMLEEGAGDLFLGADASGRNEATERIVAHLGACVLRAKYGGVVIDGADPIPREPQGEPITDLVRRVVSERVNVRPVEGRAPRAVFPLDDCEHALTEDQCIDVLARIMAAMQKSGMKITDVAVRVADKAAEYLTKG